MNNRDLTKKERDWTRRLERCLNDIPKTLEICVLNSGSVNVMERGETDKCLKMSGDLDDPEILDRIIPKTRIQIDGRDSQV